MYFPPFLKLVLTIHKFPAKQVSIDKLMELLATKNVIEIRDKKDFRTGRKELPRVCPDLWHEYTAEEPITRFGNDRKSKVARACACTTELNNVE